MVSHYTRHRLVWTGETVGRFWDEVGNVEAKKAQYFAKARGEAITIFVDHITKLDGAQALDYGCGPGHLVAHLLDRGAVVSGIDYAETSVKAANAAFSGRRNWMGAKVARGASLPWPSNTFDVICVVETIEHILDDDLPVVLDEIRRIVKPGGIVVFTTPNDEKLENNTDICPECGCEFHRWQHQRSWSGGTLSAALKAHGYQVKCCTGIDLDAFAPGAKHGWGRFGWGPGLLSRQRIRVVRDWLAHRPFPEGRTLRGFFLNKPAPHLVAVASKSAPD